MTHMHATGFWMTSKKELAPIKYGFLYNWPAVTDARYICAEGWHIWSRSEAQALMAYIETGYDNLSNTIGQKLRESGSVYWDAEGGTNDYGFNARGSGYRDMSGAFQSFRNSFHTWTSTENSTTRAWYLRCFTGNNYTASIVASTGEKITGKSLRPAKDSTTLTHGQTGTYTGNDGSMYPTICINGVEYLACDLAETKFRNGEAIPEVTDDAAWAALETAGMCAYNNDWDNV